METAKNAMLPLLGASIVEVAGIGAAGAEASEVGAGASGRGAGTGGVGAGGVVSGSGGLDGHCDWGQRRARHGWRI
jgi:hypothetical protein